MKKTMIFALCTMAICLLFSCCGSLNAKTGKWTEADFSFYDANGEERAFVTTKENSIRLSDWPELSTYRNVKIGDRAISALNKYDLPYDYTLYGVMEDKDDEIFRYTKSVNLQKEIEQCNRGDEFSILLCMTDDFKYYDCYEYILGESEPQEILWRFFFIVKDEKISDIWIARW